MGKKTLMVLSGSSFPSEADTYDLVICADSGYVAAYEAGIHVDVLVGDMDSIPEGLLKTAGAMGVEVLTYPRDKELSDGEIALREALGRNSTHISIIGGKGGRMDHIISTVLLPFLVPEGITVDIRIGPELIYLLRDGSELKLQATGMVSIIPVGDPRISVKGLRWPLEDERIPAGSTRGIHNDILDGEFTIRCRGGSAIVVLSGNEE
ncbi:MAG: thiamine diphosphokinase [Candidatus Thermoplasmatota archaeon]|nr:thiamine diphosphokinase [Candidatus Thermoplasmatota archaeon]